eukprot:gene41269-54687_t
MKLGDARAGALGVDVRALRLRSFVLISMLTGVAVAFVGTIGFVGLVAPHLSRMLVGEDQRGFLPTSALLGSLLLSLASVASKTINPGAVIPIGIVTALIGELLVTISLHGLRVAYGKKTVLHHVDMHAGSGRVLGIIGPNGCGKSTLVKAIAGLLPVQGQIRFHGATQRPRAIGYMPQDSQTPAALTVLEVVLLGRIAQLHLKVHADDLNAVSQTLGGLAFGLDPAGAWCVARRSGPDRQAPRMLLHAGLCPHDLAHIHPQGLCALHQVFAHMPGQGGALVQRHHVVAAIK